MPVLPDQYVWLFSSSMLLLVWLLLFAFNPSHRRIMLVSSLIAMPFGLTQPAFLQSYWTPPGVLDLAARFGFDIECLIFCFAIAGINVSMLKLYWGQVILPTTDPVRQPQINRWFWFTLATPFVLLGVLYFVWQGNPIYWSLLAQTGGALACMWCFREAAGKLLLISLPFTAMYMALCLLMDALAPGYFDRFWNISDISGITLLGVPIEEPLFAATFSVCANGIYLHVLWNRYGRKPQGAPSPA
ncbi:MAG: hypothetical protein EVA65_00720 [Oceanococcus sp.]|nr:MAG: hypothetical protein EVA65_00720 [Oceanococcus sp.]